MTSYHTDQKILLKLARSVLTEAVHKPWLRQLLIRQKDWLTQLIKRMRSFQRITRRLLLKQLASGGAIAALLLALAGTVPVSAATITVNGTTCTLAQAITTANNGSVQGSCTTGNASGADTIILNTDVTLSAALPNISTAITVEGNNHTVSGNDLYLVFNVTAAGSLALNEITITQGMNSSGAGITNRGSLTINNSTLFDNHSTSGSGGGGALYNADNGTYTIRNSTISANTGASGGGIGDFGGGPNLIENSTLSGNNASYGGAINVIHGSLDIQNCTIVNNHAYYGGGLMNLDPLDVSNTILNGNAADVMNPDCYAPLTDRGYNIESGTECGLTGTGSQQSVASGSLKLQALANNGTQPHPDTHALGAGSVAIDQIPIGTNGCGTTLTIDERHALRAGQVTPGDHRGGTACDIGAYEYDSEASPTSLQVNGLQARSGIPALVSSALAALGGVFAWLRLRKR